MLHDTTVMKADSAGIQLVEVMGSVIMVVCAGTWVFGEMNEPQTRQAGISGYHS
jgi:hypothetical protein